MSKKAETRHTLLQLVQTLEFAPYRDLLWAIGVKEKLYTKSEARKLIEEFFRKEVDQ